MGGELTRERMLDWTTLVAAYYAARRGKRHKPATGAWFEAWEPRLVRLRDRLAGGYTFGPYRTFYVRDPKRRLVAAAPFADRIVHHAIVACIEPACERRLIQSCVACRKGKGTGAGRALVARICRNPDLVYFAKCDVRHYFASIRHGALLRMLDRFCGDNWSRDLLARLVGSWHTEGESDAGIPIGNLTSQTFANLYLSGVDLFMTRTARARGYVRYVDDMVWFAADKSILWKQLGSLQQRLAGLGLELRGSKTRIGRVADGVDFAGAVIFPRVVRLRGTTTRRALRHVRGMRRAWLRGRETHLRYLDRLAAFVALARETGAEGLMRARGFAWLLA